MMDVSEPDFVKAAVCMATDSEQAGKYVATCAKDVCGYCGKPSLSVSYTLRQLTYLGSTQCLLKHSMTSWVPLNPTTVMVSGL
jgi:hypothetical protein